MKHGLTEKQYNAYKWIKGFIEQNGFSPSIPEISKGCGLKSGGGAFDLVKQLVERGYLTKGEGARSIALKE